MDKYQIERQFKNAKQSTQSVNVLIYREQIWVYKSNLKS